jgi:hypothetical protein
MSKPERRWCKKYEVRAAALRIDTGMLLVAGLAIARIKRSFVFGKSSRKMVLALTFVVALALSASSCGIFDTRDSEPPDTGPPVPRQEPLNPDAVIFNFTNAVEHFSQANFDEAIAADFEFVPDDADRAFFESQQGTDIFKDWGKGKETTAAQRIFADSDTLTVSWPEIISGTVTNEVLIEMEYLFRRVIIRSGEPDSVATFRGRAFVHMREDQSGLWSIDEWTDRSESEEDRTWGFLKGSVTG